jgi:hypothetical protein
MKYLISILIMAILIAIYVLGYCLNSKTKKPDNCKQIECEGCKLDCNKRG